MAVTTDDTAELLAFAALDDNKRLIAERDRLRAALAALADAADAVGVQFFDTDTMAPEVEAMQSATLKARGLLAKAAAGAA